MRMEELSDNRYIKTPDTVERYLLNLVKTYFRSDGSNVGTPDSKEYIIQKAVERMEEEVSFDNLGVLSIIFPDGEVRTGAVTITLHDLNGEPIIPNKLTAFNVDFGNEQNTACEGNDPRLSDARTPTAHNHSISDVTGLEGILSSLSGRIDRVNNFTHEHNNRQVLDILVYTGDKNNIDLASIETIDSRVIELIDELQNDMETYEQDINSIYQTISQDIADIRSEIAVLTGQSSDGSRNNFDQAKEYVDTEISNLQTLLQNEIDKLASRESINNLLNIAGSTYTRVGTMSFELASTIGINDTSYYYSMEIPIDATIIEELNNRAQTLQQCQIEITLEYMDMAGEIRYYNLPYVIIKNHVFDGMLHIGTSFSTQSISIILNTVTGELPDIIKEAKIIYDVYAKKPIVL